MIIDPRIRAYGDLSYRNPKCPKEDAEAQTIVNQVRLKYPDVLFTHIKNEGKRTKAQIDFDRSMGLLNGVSDFVFFGNPTMVMEVKRQDHTLSKWQPKQEEFLINCSERGLVAVVVFGWQAGMQAVEDWLSLQKL